EPAVSEEPYVAPSADPNFMEWWKESKFGMFIHLGSYSYYAKGEWAMSEESIRKADYQTNISKNFNPTSFSAVEIVSAARNAGMKYLVFTSKHHEGFSMWDTGVESFKDYTGETMYSLQQYTDFGNTGRDIIQELKDQCDAQGIKFGLYYSIIDWNHSSQKIDGYFTKIKSWDAKTAYINDMKAQLNELVRNYNPSILWFDGDWTNTTEATSLNWWWDKSDGQDLYDYCKSLNPNVIVNERVCRGFGLGDFECPEDEIPEIDALPDGLWETCRTMNGAWGYSVSDSGKEKSYTKIKNLVREYVNAVSRGGNYLLNIGPKGDGSVPEKQLEYLNEFGDWMKVYSDSIYGTTANPFVEEPLWGTYTAKENKLFAHVFYWPSTSEGETLTVSIEEGKEVESVKDMSTGEEIEFETAEDGSIVISSLAEEAPNTYDSVLEINYKTAE
ncbi:MAG: alpha-L-fucosidase, partial [Lachnospiraceae bacterium]|nr:alpha-L-fucosidase [Lachnospiraceae bacterium]